MSSIPPAWYPDPADARMMRYWDGSSWTQRVQPAGVSASATAVGAPISDYTGYDRIGQSNVGYVPFGVGIASAPTPARVMKGSGQTLAIWLYVFVPLLVLPHRYFSWEFSPTDFSNLAIHGGLAVVAVALAMLFAGVDRSQLRNRGFSGLPPAIVGVLPPIHVLARAIAVGPKAIAATFAALAVQAGVVALLVTSTVSPITIDIIPSATPEAVIGMTAPFTADQIAFLLTPEGMAQKIVFDSQSGVISYDTMTCDPLPSKDLGAQTRCYGAGGIAAYELVVRVMPDGTNVPFTVVSVTTELQ